MSTERFRPLIPPGPEVTAAELADGYGLRSLAPPDRPAVALNMIASLDGRITVDGRARGLANRADHELFHATRAAADAVLVGAGTVRAEGYGPMDQPAVVVSASLDLPADLGLLRAPANRVIVVTGSEGKLPACAASVEYLRTSDLNEALRSLRTEHGIEALDCEGGAHLNSALLASGLVDELHLVISPRLVGGPDPLTVVAGGLLDPPAAARLVSVAESGGWLFTRWRLT